MNFNEIAKARQSCRSYNSERAVENEKIEAIIESAILSPSACNSQPYTITVCTGDIARSVAEATSGPVLNKFAKEAPVLLVISEEGYSPTAAIGAKIKDNDYRSIDIGILAAYITAEATALGLGSCILGWFDNEKIKKICSLDKKVRLVITVGYPKEEGIRPKKRKDRAKLVKFLES